MAVLMLPWTPCSTRYFSAPAMASAGSYTLATPSPLASVATPATASDAGWTGAPPQVLPAAPPLPICIRPAAPNPFDPLCPPGAPPGGRRDRGPPQGVPPRPADPDLHRARRAERVRSAVHAGQVGPAVVALHLAAPGEHGPWDAVLGAELVPGGEVVGRDGVARCTTDRRLHGRSREV